MTRLVLEIRVDVVLDFDWPVGLEYCQLVVLLLWLDSQCESGTTIDVMCNDVMIGMMIRLVHHCIVNWDVFRIDDGDGMMIADWKDCVIAYFGDYCYCWNDDDSLDDEHLLAYTDDSHSIDHFHHHLHHIDHDLSIDYDPDCWTHNCLYYSDGRPVVLILVHHDGYFDGRCHRAAMTSNDRSKIPFCLIPNCVGSVLLNGESSVGGVGGLWATSGSVVFLGKVIVLNLSQLFFGVLRGVFHRLLGSNLI